MKKLAPLQSSDFNILLTAVLYYLSAEFAFYLAFDDRVSLPFWPPAGMALALVILYGRQVWPGLAIGSLVFTVKNFWFGSIDDFQMVIAVGAIITASRVLEPIAGELLLRKLTNKKYPFSKTTDAFHFVGVTLLVSLISSGISALTLSATGVAGEPVMSNLFSLWARNVVGILLFTPIILSIPNLRPRQFDIRKAGELAIFIICFACMTLLFNVGALRNVFQYALPFAVIPFMLWLAFRFDGVISMLGCVIVSLCAIYFTSLQVGPFYLPEQNVDSVLLLQVYVVVVNVSGLVLASAVHERQEAQADLKKFSENLESIVLARTNALKQEIQSRNEAQQKLQQTNVELVKRNSELDSFVYSVSHDLRAPISSILGLIHVAKIDKGQHLKGIYLDMMERSTRQQDHFIREILDQSKNARSEVTREPILFRTLIEEAFEQLEFVDTEGKKFEKVIDVKQSEPFYCDKWRLKVILNNILSNSIRYRNGRDPVIRINARIDNNKVNLQIEDNGRGINKEHISHLGKMFYRATDQGAGAGLGLYIVKETLQKLKGSMEIESEEGHGTMVRLDIPELA